jgi:hypothetical protein
MAHVHSRIVLLLSALGMLAFAASLSAGGGGSPAGAVPRTGGGESYGPGANLLVIPPTEFFPYSSLETYAAEGDGYYYSTSGGRFVAGVQLPAGASVPKICVSTYDNDPSNQLYVYWYVHEMKDTGPGASFPLGQASTGTAATPGFGSTCINLAPPTLIHKYGDSDGDGQSGYIWYDLAVVSESSSDSIRWGAAEITWLRQVSPAPAAATFGDVPTNFLYFRAIEALAASGITSGCGGGNFCPGQNVTRGEMAAFLARALGLHWPI